MYCVLLNDKPLYHQLDRDKLPLSYFHPGYALHSVSFSLLPSKPPSSRSNDCRWILKCYSCSAIPVQQHESPAVQDDGDFSSVLSTTRSALRRRPSRNVTGMRAFSNCYVGKIGYYTVTGPLLVGHGRRLVGRMSYGHCLFSRCGVQWTLDTTSGEETVDTPECCLHTSRLPWPTSNRPCLPIVVNNRGRTEEKEPQRSKRHNFLII